MSEELLDRLREDEEVLVSGNGDIWLTRKIAVPDTSRPTWEVILVNLAVLAVCAGLGWLLFWKL